jgi:cytosine/adenosine deaminase-related metal-dependent hydrolase
MPGPQAVNSGAFVRAMLVFAVLASLLGAPAVAQSGATTLFIRVNIVPMDRERVLRNQSVLVRDGEIAVIGSRLIPPRGARVIDGGGTAYLLPGLADMHVHVRDRESLALLLASGVTSALDMGEAPNSIVGRTRAAIERGEVKGPRLFAALAVDGTPRYGHLVVPSPEAARWAVRLAKANGYDFIKVYNGLSRETFEALIQEGQALGIPVVGHTVESLGLERQIVAGQAMVAHLEEFLYGFFRFPPGRDQHAAPDEAEITRAVGFLTRSGATVTADLATYETIAEQWGKPQQIRAYLSLPETRYLSPGDRIDWQRSGYQRRTGRLDARAAFLRRFVRKLADAKVPLIAGTDAPTIPGLVVGNAIQKNLAALEAAGLSRYQALATATREPGLFVSRVKPGIRPFGVVAEGMRADLLLVAANPLEDLAALRRPLGVMAAGRWHDEASLRATRDDVEQLYRLKP